MGYNRYLFMQSYRRAPRGPSPAKWARVEEEWQTAVENAVGLGLTVDSDIVPRATDSTPLPV